MEGIVLDSSGVGSGRTHLVWGRGLHKSPPPPAVTMVSEY